jgi:putative SOS response-associated peptidase YedK
MAGLWESWQDPDTPSSAPLKSCTIITTEANEIMAELHDRMPVLLDRSSLNIWLKDETAQPKHRLELLKPCASELLSITPANPWLNRVTNEGPRCLEPPEDVEVQGKLF